MLLWIAGIGMGGSAASGGPITVGRVSTRLFIGIRIGL